MAYQSEMADWKGGLFPNGHNRGHVASPYATCAGCRNKIPIHHTEAARLRKERPLRIENVKKLLCPGCRVIMKV